MAQLDFNSEGIEPLQPFDVLPKDWYTVEITDSKMKPTAAGTGEYLQLEMTVIDGPFANRKLWSRLNLRNPNQTAEEIARRELAAICHAVGVTKVGDSIELHGRPLKVEVIVEKRRGNGEDSNRVKAYAAADGEQPKPAAAAKPASKPAGTNAPPPWAKNKAA